MSTTTEPLAPKLRPLDEKVLAALGDRGMRAETVAAAVLGQPWWRCETCGRETAADGLTSWAWQRRLRIGCRGCWNDAIAAGNHDNDRRETMVAFQQPSAEDIRTAREVLRGLECVGRAEQHGGWWRRT